MESQTISFRVPEWLLEAIQKRAESERRTVGSMVRVLLERQITSSPENVVLNSEMVKILEEKYYEPAKEEFENSSERSPIRKAMDRPKVRR